MLWHVLELDTTTPIWEQFFTVAPLVVVGTRHADGSPNLAPKHMAGPLSWDNYFGFVCAESHATLANLRQTLSFAVSYPRPDQVLLAALAASPCAADVPKSAVISHLPVEPGRLLPDPLLIDASIQLECRLHAQLEIGPNVLVVGEVVQARVHPDSVRCHDGDDHDRLHRSPLLAYIAPGRYSMVRESEAFPFPRGYHL